MRAKLMTAMLAALMVQGFAFAESGQEDSQKDSTELRVRKLIADLGNPDFKAREKATEELIQIGEPGLAQVRKALESPEEEVKARAKRIIEAIEKASASKQEGKAGGSAPGAGEAGRRLELKEQNVRKLLDEMMKRMLKDREGSDREDSGEPEGPGRAMDDLLKELDDFFGKDDFWGLKPGDREGWKEFWKKWSERQARAFPELDELKKWSRKLEEEIERIRKAQVPGRNLRQSITIGNGSFRMTSVADGETVTYSREQDGSVRLEVEGKEGKKTYAAASEKEFREKYPEEIKKYVDGRFTSRFSVRFGGPGLRGHFGRPVPVQDRLGITAAPVGEILQSHLKLDPGSGFLVMEVAEGSEAAGWGIAQYDIVLSLGGAPVDSLEGFKAALAAVEPGSELSIGIIRRAERTVVKAKR